MSSARVRPLDRLDEAELDLVAQRMRLTLIEVLGEERGARMYTMDWLRNRVRWHLDPTQCTGEVFVIEEGGEILGHTIVRVDSDETGPIGLFSTTYVERGSREHGHAEALLLRGEAWLMARGMTTLVTDTSESNRPLIALFEKHGYGIILSEPELRMVRLSKRV